MKYTTKKLYIPAGERKLKLLILSPKNTHTYRTGVLWIQPYKGKIRKPGTGCVTMINDHLYEGRFSPRLNGKRISKNIYATTREECEEKLKVLIAEMKREIAEAKAAGETSKSEG